MARRGIKFLSVLILVALSLALFYYNREAVRFSLGPVINWEAPLAIIVATSFFVGAAVIGLISFGIGIRHSIYDWNKDRRIRKTRAHDDLIRQAHEHLALQSWSNAEALLLKTTAQDPHHVVAWSLLSRCYEEMGDPLAALRTLDAGRASNQENPELLIRTAELNEQAGNLALAVDSLLLVLNQYPRNEYVLTKVSALCKRLGRYDEAARHLQELVRNPLGKNQVQNSLNELADLELRFISKRFENDPAALRAALQELIRKHKEFPPAMHALALVEKEERQANEATKLWTKAYQPSGNVTYLQHLAEMWLEQNDPDRAIATVKNAVLVTKRGQSSHVEGNLYLCELYYSLSMFDHLQAELDSLGDRKLSPTQENSYLLLKANLAIRNRAFNEATSLLFTIVANNCVTAGLSSTLRPTQSKSPRLIEELKGLPAPAILEGEPSPQLSTP